MKKPSSLKEYVEKLEEFYFDSKEYKFSNATLRVIFNFSEYLTPDEICKAFVALKKKRLKYNNMNSRDTFLYLCGILHTMKRQKSEEF